MPWLPIALCVTMPFVVVGVFLYLRSEYGDAFFLLQDKHDLNDPADPRITRLNLK